MNDPQVIFPVSLEPSLSPIEIAAEMDRRYRALRAANPGCECQVKTWLDDKFPFKRLWQTSVVKQLVAEVQPERLLLTA